MHRYSLRAGADFNRYWWGMVVAMKRTRKFILSKPQREVLACCDDLKQGAFEQAAYGYYWRANFMVRIAERMYQEVLSDKLSYLYELSWCSLG
jgi:hypothetical protein